MRPLAAAVLLLAAAGGIGAGVAVIRDDTPSQAEVIAYDPVRKLTVLVVPDSAITPPDTTPTDTLPEPPDSIPPDTMPPVPQPPGVPAECANLPVDYAVLTIQPFTAVPPVAPAKDQYGWNTRTSGRQNIAIRTEAGTSSFMRVTWPKGHRGGTAPAAINFKYPGRNSVYFCARHRIDPMVFDSALSGIKWGFLWGSGINHVFSQYKHHAFTMQHQRQTLPDGTVYTSFNLCKNGATYSVGSRGQWRVYEVLVVGGHAGQPDGAITEWINGKLACAATGVRFFGPNHTQEVINEVKDESTLGGAPVNWTNPYATYHDVDWWVVAAPKS